MDSSTFHAAEVAAKRSWDAAGLNQENSLSLKSRPSNEFKSGRPPLTTTNGTSLNRKTSREHLEGPSRNNSHENVPQARRTGDLPRKSSNIGRSTSEPDNTVDFYGQPRARSNSKGEHTERTGQTKGHVHDQDKWIHRDKLAKIESEELQAAGISIPSRRTMSKSSGRRALSRNNSAGTANDYDENAILDPEAERRRPSLPAVEDNEVERMNWDLRTPEEIAAEAEAEREAASIYGLPAARKSGSRIPVATTSPLPINRGDIERNTPLTRRRNTSGTGEDDGLRFGSSRSRANSVGSQVLLDDFEHALETSPMPMLTPSRPGTRNGLSTSPSKPALGKSPTASATPGSRKTSSSNPGARKASGQKSRATSNNNSNNRPTTRSGDADRPKTAINRPEGDPPWLATMYKPDPRLPPDQQIIPTHARRQQRAQWDANGDVPITYDRNFSPLAVHTAQGLKPSTPSPKSRSPDKLDPDYPGQNAWPLKKSPSYNNINSTSPPSRPGTSGGYSTMPNVRSPPLVGSSPRVGSGPLSQGQQVIRQPTLPEDEEKGSGGKKKEGGCGCCIVM